MTQVLITEEYLDEIGEAIREKRGVSTKFLPSEMADAISAISGGGVLDTLTIVQNGTYTPETGYDGFSEVTANVPNSYSASDEGKVVSSGSLVGQTSRNVSQNGTYDTTLNDEVVVNVSGGGGIATLLNKSQYNPTSQGSWITFNESVTISKQSRYLIVAIGYTNNLIVSVNGVAQTLDFVDSSAYVRYFTKELDLQVNDVVNLNFPSSGRSAAYALIADLNGGSGGENMAYTGLAAPTSDIGSDGDYYYQYESSNDIEFDYTGSIEQFTAPETGVYKIKAYGAKGGDAKASSTSLQDAVAGGNGGYSYGEISLTQGDVLYIVVGGAGNDDLASGSTKTGGYNGGGASYAYETRASRSSGGGASHVALRTGLLSELENYTSDILIVAGGGGGASNFNNIEGRGGAGGGTTGSTGTGSDGTAGTGGSQSAGGTGGSSGSFGQGGNRTTQGNYGGAGGGGGYYGGGGANNNMGAGGGSGFVSASLSNTSMESGVNNGDGKVVISVPGGAIVRTVTHVYLKENGAWIEV